MSDSEQTTAQQLHEAAEQIGKLQTLVVTIQSRHAADISRLRDTLQREQSAFCYMSRAFDILHKATENSSISLEDMLTAQVDALRLSNRGGHVHLLNNAILASSAGVFETIAKKIPAIKPSDTDDCRELVADGEPVDFEALITEIIQTNMDVAEKLAKGMADPHERIKVLNQVDVVRSALAAYADGSVDTKKQAGAATEDTRGK